MAVDYNDERFTQVNNEKATKTTELSNTYNNMINNSDKYYQAQIDASKEYAEKQQELQQANTDFTIEKINQDKEQAEKDYIKEQKASYADYQKEINKYGVNAEKMASSGLQNTGYSESSKVSMYNTYQNRYATAKQSYDQAVLNYNNSIKEAQLANNSALAEIAYNALQTQLELSLEGFQYKNELVLNKINAIQDLDNTYYSRYQDVLNQINTENQLEEEKRQYNESLALQKAQLEEEKRQFNASLSASKSSSSGSSSKSSSSVGTASNVLTDTEGMSAEEKANLMETVAGGVELANGNETILDKYRTTIYTLVQQKKLTEDEASMMFSQLGL